jgi:hemoglobin
MRRMLATVGLSVMVAVLGAGLAGCASTGERKMDPSLYQRLGGREGIALVSNALVDNMAKDPRLSARFKAMKPPEVFRLKSMIADQICDATGGPCAYLGRDMKTTHKGMKITEAEWNATVENLVKALDARKVGEREKKELIAVLAPMKGDIVGQ